jgi:hypothetical protein
MEDRAAAYRGAWSWRCFQLPLNIFYFILLHGLSFFVPVFLLPFVEVLFCICGRIRRNRNLLGLSVLLLPAAITTAEDKTRQRDAGGCTEAIVEVAEEPVLMLTAASAQNSTSLVRWVIPRTDGVHTANRRLETSLCLGLSTMPRRRIGRVLVTLHAFLTSALNWGGGGGCVWVCGHI